MAWGGHVPRAVCRTAGPGAAALTGGIFGRWHEGRVLVESDSITGFLGYCGSNLAREGHAGARSFCFPRRRGGRRQALELFTLQSLELGELLCVVSWL